MLYMIVRCIGHNVPKNVPRGLSVSWIDLLAYGSRYPFVPVDPLALLSFQRPGVKFFKVVIDGGYYWKYSI